MIRATKHAYIVTDSRILSGEPIIRGTRTPVRAIVEPCGSALLLRQYQPTYLISPYITLAQVFDALSYYSDHQADINAHIERNHIPEELIHPM